MKKILFLALSLLFFSQIYAQDAVFDWAGSIGSSSLDRVSDIAVDDLGNTYITGAYDITTDFDPGFDAYDLTPIGSLDIYIAKLNNLGEFEWALSFGDSGSDYGVSIFTDDMGFIYLTGRFGGTIDFDPSPDIFELTSESSADCFVLKLNGDGEFIWARGFGGALFDLGRSIIVDEIGNVHTTGTFKGTVDFDPGAGVFDITSAGEEDVFIQKLNSDGDFIWAKSIGGIGKDQAESIRLDISANIYVGGNYEGTCDFDPSIDDYFYTSSGFLDHFILKLNTDGDFIWAVTFGGTSGDGFGSMDIDNEGNIYSTGSFSLNMDADPGAGDTEFISRGSNDFFIQKLDNDGNFVWAKQVGGSDQERSFSIKLDTENNLYTTGYFLGTTDFDPNAGETIITAEGLNDIFIHKLDTDGNLVWIKVIGSTGLDEGSAIDLDMGNNIYLTGTFENTVDFNTGVGLNNLESTGELDIFILKLNSCTIDEITDEITSCISHTWINGETYFTDNNTATFTLTNLEGCDSIISLDLTINEVDISTTAIDGVITSNATGATYQWLDCNDDYAEIEGETDMNYTPIADGSYAVRVQQGECVDTSECITIAGVGITDENNQLSEIKIFPNPSNGLVYVDLSELSDVLINVYALNGEVVYNANNLNDQIHSFHLNVETGIYILEVMTNEHLEQLKLVVE